MASDGGTRAVSRDAGRLRSASSLSQNRRRLLRSRCTSSAAFGPRHGGDERRTSQSAREKGESEKHESSMETVEGARRTVRRAGDDAEGGGGHGQVPAGPTSRLDKTHFLPPPPPNETAPLLMMRLELLRTALCGRRGRRTVPRQRQI